MFEELEQIPWSELVSKPRRPAPWAVALLVGLVVGGIVWFRFGLPPVEAPAAATAPPRSALTPPVDIAEPGEAVMVSEADLRADDEPSELLAMGAAVVEIRALSSTRHYVEWAVADNVTALGDGIWAVRVAFQVLVPGPDGAERSAVRRVEVPMQIVDGIARRSGPMSLSVHEPGPAVDLWETRPVPVTTRMIDTVEELFAEWNIEEVESAGSFGGATRVLVRTAGMTISLWLDEVDRPMAVPIPFQAGS